MPYEVILYRKNSGQVMGQFGPYARKADAQADARALATQANPDWGAMVKKVGEAIGKGAKAAGKGIAKGVKHGTEYAREGAARAAETARDTAAKAKDAVVMAKLSGRVEGLQSCYEALGGRRALGGIKLEGLRAYQEAEDELRDYTEESKRGAYKRKTSRESAREKRAGARSARLAANPATVYREGNVVRWRRGQHSMTFHSAGEAKEAVKRFKKEGPAWDWREIKGRMESIRRSLRKNPQSRKNSTRPQEALDYGTTVKERRQREWVVYSKGKAAAIRKAKESHPGKQITDLLLVGTDHLGYDEWLYNTKAKSRKNPPDGAPSTRRFDGRVYRYHSSVTNKKMAEAKAKRARKLDGLNARIVQIGHRHYAIYTSKRSR